MACQLQLNMFYTFDMEKYLPTFTRLALSECSLNLCKGMDQNVLTAYKYWCGGQNPTVGGEQS